jgi:DNA-binding MarR family transcriptional regulator
VEKSGDEKDNRVVLLRASEAGHHTLEIARAKRLAALQSLLTQLDGSERKMVEDAVSVLEPLLRP